MTEFDLTVHSKRDVADGIVTLELKTADGADLPDWSAGAHIDLVPANGLVRQYSLCGDPQDRTLWRIAVLREPEGRGGSRYIHDELREGEVVRVRGPRNHFALEPAEDYLFIAGGIGITPILTMIHSVDAAGRSWRLVYGGRRAATMAFARELRERYGDRVTVLPQDERGLLDLDALLGTPVEGTMVYCCGPNSLIAAVEERCAKWPAGALHTERFTPAPLEAPVSTESFEVELSASGTVLTVPPDRSILEVLLENGVDVLSSCEEGTCGTCETVVLDGQVDHRDSMLDAAERASNDKMMVCVSRAACPRLVLDL